MKNLFFNLSKVIILLFIINFNSLNVYSEEEDTNTILKVLEDLQKDIKTLEKAVYSGGINSNSSNEILSVNDNDILTKHLLKLSELEDQFKSLTNNFEEINFKIDKLSNRITKIQTDNQVRFQDIESNTSNNKLTKKKNLPGSDQPQDLGGISDTDVASLETVQKTQSIETTTSVVTEKFSNEEEILPSGSPEEQYEFATSFLKVGDYDTAEVALKEFVKKNIDHDLAGNAQYWYAETFRIRQLFTDAASAYLEGYQKYPKSKKAPINLLKLGVSLVQIGEKDQGCSMISGVSKQYPKANQSVLQKAKYEEKKFGCPIKKT